MYRTWSRAKECTQQESWYCSLMDRYQYSFGESFRFLLWKLRMFADAKLSNLQYISAVHRHHKIPSITIKSVRTDASLHKVKLTGSFLCVEEQLLSHTTEMPRRHEQSRHHSQKKAPVEMAFVKFSVSFAFTHIIRSALLYFHNHQLIVLSNLSLSHTLTLKS